MFRERRLSQGTVSSSDHAPSVPLPAWRKERIRTPAKLMSRVTGAASGPSCKFVFCSDTELLVRCVRPVQVCLLLVYTTAQSLCPDSAEEGGLGKSLGQNPGTTLFIVGVQHLNYSSEDSVLQFTERKLSTHYCSVCGAHALVTEVDFRSLPRRGSDDAVVLQVGQSSHSDGR